MYCIESFQNIFSWGLLRVWNWKLKHSVGQSWVLSESTAWQMAPNSQYTIVIVLCFVPSAKMINDGWLISPASHPLSLSLWGTVAKQLTDVVQIQSTARAFAAIRANGTVTFHFCFGKTGGVFMSVSWNYENWCYVWFLWGNRSN